MRRAWKGVAAAALRASAVDEPRGTVATATRFYNHLESQSRCAAAAAMEQVRRGQHVPKQRSPGCGLQHRVYVPPRAAALRQAQSPACLASSSRSLLAVGLPPTAWRVSLQPAAAWPTQRLPDRSPPRGEPCGGIARSHSSRRCSTTAIWCRQPARQAGGHTRSAGCMHGLGNGWGGRVSSLNSGETPVHIRGRHGGSSTRSALPAAPDDVAASSKAEPAAGAAAEGRPDQSEVQPGSRGGAAVARGDGRRLRALRRGISQDLQSVERQEAERASSRTLTSRLAVSFRAAFQTYYTVRL